MIKIVSEKKPESAAAEMYPDRRDAVALLNEHATDPERRCEAVGEDETSRLYDDARDAALTTKPRPGRPVSAARIGLSKKAHPRPYNDPSNYLG